MANSENKVQSESRKRMRRGDAVTNSESHNAPKKAPKRPKVKKTDGAVVIKPPKEAAPAKIPRSFSEDLTNYLNSWKSKMNGEANDWKFNKVLQSWALDNCTDGKKMDNAVFKELLPYISTVQGSARERLSVMVNAILEDNPIVAPVLPPSDAANPAASKTEVDAEEEKVKRKRAKKIALIINNE